MKEIKFLTLSQSIALKQECAILQHIFNLPNDTDEVNIRQ